MKRQDGTIVPDSYDRYEALQRDREVKKRLEKLEAKVKALEEALLAK